MASLATWVKEQIMGSLYEALEQIDPLVKEMWRSYYGPKIESIIDKAVINGDTTGLAEFYGTEGLIEVIKDHKDELELEKGEAPKSFLNELSEILNELSDDLASLAIDVEDFPESLLVPNPHTKYMRDGVLVINVALSGHGEVELSAADIEWVLGKIEKAIEKQDYTEEEVEKVISGLEAYLKKAPSKLLEVVSGFLDGKDETYLWDEIYQVMRESEDRMFEQFIRDTGTHWPPKKLGEPLFLGRRGKWLTFSKLKNDLWYFSEEKTFPGVVEFWGRLRKLSDKYVDEYEKKANGEFLLNALIYLADSSGRRFEDVLTRSYD